MSPVSRGELESYRRKVNQRKACCVPESMKSACTGRIVKAHTVSRAGSLKEIAEDGHVMGIRASLDFLIKHNGRIDLVPVGIRDASTFNGFCQNHDRIIFSPIENDPIIPTAQQCFLLAYRSLSREFFHKQSQVSLPELMRSADRGQGLKHQVSVQGVSSTFGAGVSLALNDVAVLKNYFDTALVESNFEGLEHCVFEFDETPKLLVSTMVAPLMDFQGGELQALGLDSPSYSYITFNCVAIDGKGFFIFSWAKQHSKVCSAFIESLLKLESSRISDALVRFCYSFSDNVWAAPSWWKSLSLTQKNSIRARFDHGTTRQTHPSNCLLEDGVSYNAFSVATVSRM